MKNTSKIGSALQHIEQAITDAEWRLEKLRAGRDALAALTVRRPARGRHSKTAGTMRDEILAWVKDHPGSSSSDLFAAIGKGHSKQNIWNAISQLRKQKRLKPTKRLRVA